MKAFGKIQLIGMQRAVITLAMPLENNVVVDFDHDLSLRSQVQDKLPPFRHPHITLRLVEMTRAQSGDLIVFNHRLIGG